MKKTIEDNHSALPDAKALVEILYYIGLANISGPIYPSHCTSLQIIKWLGPACERTLFNKNIRSLEQLIANIVANYSIYNLSTYLDLGSFVHQYITKTCGIMSGNSKSISESIVAKWLPTTINIK